jgi:AraC-like DNA-binding protein
MRSLVSPKAKYSRLFVDGNWRLGRLKWADPAAHSEGDMSNGILQCEYAGDTRGTRYEAWREQFASRWLSADFESITSDQFVNKIEASEHSFIALCHMHSTPVRIKRRSDAVVGAAGHRYLIIASGSRVEAQQRGKSVTLSIGQMILMSADEPAQLTQLQGDRWSIRIPHQILESVCQKAEEKIARPIQVSDDLLRLLLHQMDTAQRFGPKLDASANYLIAQHVFDIFGLCVGMDDEAAKIACNRGLAAARLESIKTDLLRCLDRSDANLSVIAARHGLSRRYVQHLFELTGTSFTSFVVEQRLMLAHRMLCEPNSQWRKISDIAAAAGFSDISYFNRAFKSRFGRTPGDVRNLRRSADGTPPA